VEGPRLNALMRDRLNHRISIVGCKVPQFNHCCLARLYVCEQSSELLGIPKGDVIPEALVAGAATLADLMRDADSVLSL
jgi:predicted peroxiredoxin